MTALIEEPQEDVRLERRVNHIGKILKTSHELRMTAQIGDYDTILFCTWDLMFIFLLEKPGKVWER